MYLLDKPVGHHTLRNTVSRLCKAAGITGFRTNHSLRATAATRLYRSGIDEQMVVEHTGHRSLEGVRSYKRTSDTQKKAMSDILNSKRIHTEESSIPSLPISAFTYSSTPTSTSPVPLQPQAMQANIQNIPAGTFQFNSCSSITLNIHQNK